MKVLITGGAGLLATALVASAPEHHRVEVTWHNARPSGPVKATRVELTQSLAFFEVAQRRRPDLVIHTAYSKTDHLATIDMTTEVASVCDGLGIELIHLSSDVIFDGLAESYDESAVPSPVNAYGRAKARCEAIVADSVPNAALVRTSLILAPDASDGTSSWLVAALAHGESPTLFVDEFRRPIWVSDLAAQVWELVDLDTTERAGVWNLVGPERLSRVELGQRIAAQHGLDASLIVPASSDSMDEPRPKDLNLLGTRRGLSWPARTIGSVGDYGSSITE